MGTSRNDRSPQIPPWRPAFAVLGKTDVSPERQSKEIWRAAFADRGNKLLEDLSHPGLVTACKLVSQQTPLNKALHEYDKKIKHEDRSGLAIELGRRALVRTLTQHRSASDFAAELFGETAAYYVSRDLPSYVAAHNRVATTSAAIRLKNDLRRIAHDKALAAGPVHAGTRQWRIYIHRVLTLLQGATAR